MTRQDSLYCFWVFISMSLATFALYGDDLIILKNGGQIEGSVVDENRQTLTIRLPNGTLQVPRSQVKEIKRNAVSAREITKDTDTATAESTSADEIHKIVEGALPSLQDGANPAERWRAMRKLLALGKHAVPRLGELLLQEDAGKNVAAGLVETLSRIGTQQAKQEIFRYAKKRREKSAPEAIRALGLDPRPETLALLEYLLHVPHEKVKKAALDALAKTRTPEALELILGLTVPDNESATEDENREDESTQAVVDYAKGTLKELLQDNKIVRRAGMLFLPRIKDQRPITSLMKKKLLRLLEEVKTPEAVAALQDGMTHDPELFGTVIDALGKMGTEPAQNLLLEQINGLSAQERDKKIAIIRAFGQMQADPNSNHFMPTLIALLDSNDPQIEQAVIETLKSCTGCDFGDDAYRWAIWWHEYTQSAAGK